MSASPANYDARLQLAIVCNSLPPYRVHLHRRIVREMPEVKLWTLCTHEGEDARWGFDPPGDINAVSFRRPGVLDQHGVSWASWKKGGRIIRWMEQNRVGAVVVMGYNDPCRARIIRWGRRKGVPCFVFGDSNIRGDNVSGFQALVKRLVVGWVTRQSAAMLPCGSLGRAFFEKYGASPDRIHYFPYEPDYQEIAGITRQEIASALSDFGLAPGRRRLVFSGRMVDQKRPDLVIKSFAAVAAQRSDWDLVMAGDGPLMAETKALVPPELTGRIYWTGFINDQRKLSALYRGSDVLVLPSRHEPWALVINEAAAAGMAIIASDVVGAAAELVRDGVNGKVFKTGDLAEMTRSLLWITDPVNIDRLKAASPQILDQWRAAADPVKGLRAALAQNGIAVRA